MTELNNIDHTIETRLRAKNLRPTRARKMILKMYADGANHMSCEEIVKKVLKQDSAVGQATVYQNVGLLAENGLLCAFKGPDGILLHDAVHEHHHHLLCTSCGKVADVLIEGHCESLVPYALDETKTVEGWHIQERKVEFHGICPNCR